MISIIIVNYRTTEILGKCVESLYNFEDSNTFEVIIVDNASEDGSSEILTALSEKYSNLRCIFLEKSVSFAQANNEGAESASGDYLMIMNPDIIFTKPVLNALEDYLRKNPDSGAVSPLLFGEDGKFQSNYFQRYPTIIQFILFHSFISVFFRRSEFLIKRYLVNTTDRVIKEQDVRFVEQLPFAFFLITKKLFFNTGKMDNNFDIYFEDVDFSFRINKKHKLAVFCGASVKHIGGVTFNKEENWWVYGKFAVSMLYFFRKNYGTSRYITLKLLLILNSDIVLLKERIKKIFRLENKYRYKKHTNFFEELKKQNRKFDLHSNSKL